jgi:hypothetical protein
VFFGFWGKTLHFPVQKWILGVKKCQKRAVFSTKMGVLGIEMAFLIAPASLLIFITA